MFVFSTTNNTDEFHLAAMGESRLLKCFERHIEIPPPAPPTPIVSASKRSILEYTTINPVLVDDDHVDDGSEPVCDMVSRSKRKLLLELTGAGASQQLPQTALPQQST